MKPVEARLLEIQGTPDDLEAFRPEDPENFQLSVALRIGPTDAEGGDFFYVSICSPRWLATRVATGGPEWCTATLIVKRWDRSEIENFLRRWVAGAKGASWTELASSLSRNANWEYGRLPAPPSTS
jgi:Immunity protein 8